MNRYLAKQTLLTAALFAATTGVAVTAQAEEVVRTDRYTLARVEVLPEQQEPLRAVATFTFGSHIRTVGDALREMLKGSGYHWEPSVATAEGYSDTLLNTLPLPAVLRSMGPVRLDDALRATAGEAWDLNVNNLRRTVWFTVNEDRQEEPGHARGQGKRPTQKEGR